MNGSTTVAPFGAGYVDNEPSGLCGRRGCRRVSGGSTLSLEKLLSSGAVGVDASFPRCSNPFITSLIVFNADLRGMNVYLTVSSGPDAPWLSCDRCHTGSLAIESGTQCVKDRTIIKSAGKV
jgi:hypothetical protein